MPEIHLEYFTKYSPCFWRACNGSRELFDAGRFKVCLLKNRLITPEEVK